VSDRDQNHDVAKLAELMKGIRFVMLTTVEEDGSLHSRPMTTQAIEFDGDLWFFTAIDSLKVTEVKKDREVNVSFSDPDKKTFISVSGTASLVRDRVKIRELWKPAYKVFFPKGLDDPELALLKVSVKSAEYWDSPSSAVGRLVSFAKAYVTGDVGQLGEHEHIKVK
jgi:general stress protein 26